MVHEEDRKKPDIVWPLLMQPGDQLCQAAQFGSSLLIIML
jgi:hypothetical protein